MVFSSKRVWGQCPPVPRAVHRAAGNFARRSTPSHGKRLCRPTMRELFVSSPMTVSLAGRAPATFEIKSATLPLVALLLKSPDLFLLAQEFQERYGDMPEFFDGDPLVVDLSPLHGEGEIDFPRLVEL